MKYTADWFREYRQRRTGQLPHGTQQGYANWGCRCNSCREGHAIHVAEWRYQKWLTGYRAEQATS